MHFKVVIDGGHMGAGKTPRELFNGEPFDIQKEIEKIIEEHIKEDKDK